MAKNPTKRVSPRLGILWKCNRSINALGRRWNLSTKNYRNYTIGVNLTKAGNARVRRGMIQLAWRFIRFQPDSALAKWFYARTADGRKKTRKTMIVALARKLLIALWRLVTTGEVPTGVMLRAA